jgi:tetratricopeptide (TPR) repeat protein
MDHYQNGMDRLSEGKYKEAIVEFQKGLKTEPNSPVLHYELGVAYGKNEQYDEAIAELTKFLALTENTGVKWEKERWDANFNIEKYKEKIIEKETGAPPPPVTHEKQEQYPGQ